MSIFQKSVLNSISQDESKIALRWAEYQKYLSKIDYVKSVKEEKYQDGFLKDVFENCLGYTLDSTNPSDFNLERERKNETDGKKVDGAIFIDAKVTAVVELKAQNTKNLDKATDQAFGYLVSNSDAKYVIVSNFDELRFYFDKKTAYEKFSLFNLDYEEFKKLHLLISFESIKDDIPLKLKEKTTTFEQTISKDLYKDFSSFRTHLFENLIKNNDLDKSLLLRLTQKVCDRIIFILFAEDRGLLTANTINEIRQRHSQDVFGNSMYEYYKIYFNAINEGNPQLNIPRYNGGLFSTDEQLNSLVIDDDVLDMEAQKLSNYDFDSEVSVNILGHIFEQSLTDLEEIQSNIEYTKFDKSKSKRKKDGVFYTPEYITKYIVDNTLGKLCKEKREELKLAEVKAPKNPRKLNKGETLTKQNLEEYKEWLFNLKVLDPACGSGAFLNQALEFLIHEHKLLQNDLALMGDLFASYTVEESVLEHNLYGVDINEDAVEIAKLSLWLRTAKKGRPLTKLADKILCANSLLDMPFEEGSFDVVIGNPPYVRQESIKHLKDDLKEKYEVFSGTADLYVYFYELGIKMLKDNALLGYICSNKYYKAKYGEKLRNYILENVVIEEFTDFGDKKVFEDAVVTSDISIFKKSIIKENISFKVVDINLISFYEMKQTDLEKSGFVFLPKDKLALKLKIETKGQVLKNWDVSIKSGIKTGFNEAFIIDEEKKDELIKLDRKNKEVIKPYLRGRDVERYNYNFKKLWLLNIHNNPPVNVDEYPYIKEHLDKYYEKLIKRSDKGETPYNLRNCAFLKEFEKEKIIWIELSDLGKFTLDINGNYVDMTIFFITGNSLKYLLAILNSKLVLWYFNLICAESGVGTNRWKKTYVEQLPIPQLSDEKQTVYIDNVDTILKSKETVTKYNKHFDSLNAVEKIEIKEEIEKLESTIENSINEIDTMVYDLYELSKKEIKTIENE